MFLRFLDRVLFDTFKVLSKNQSLRWNHYKSLGLTPSASMAEIKDAYYRLSKIHHPDRNNGSETSARRFRDIVAAYEVLGREDTRRKYDRETIRRYQGVNHDAVLKKKANKRTKKSSLPKMKSRSKTQIKTRYKTGSGGGKVLTKKENEEFENFVVRAIPFVVACLMCCKKH